MHDCLSCHYIGALAPKHESLFLVLFLPCLTSRYRLFGRRPSITENGEANRLLPAYWDWWESFSSLRPTNHASFLVQLKFLPISPVQPPLVLHRFKDHPLTLDIKNKSPFDGLLRFFFALFFSWPDFFRFTPIFFFFAARGQKKRHTKPRTFSFAYILAFFSPLTCIFSVWNGNPALYTLVFRKKRTIVPKIQKITKKIYKISKLIWTLPQPRISFSPFSISFLFYSAGGFFGPQIPGIVSCFASGICGTNEISKRGEL